MRRVFVSVGIACALVTAVLTTGAAAAPALPPGLSPAQQTAVAALDQQIATSKGSVAGWTSWLQSWSVRIDRAELHFSRVKASRSASPAKVAAAHAHMDAILGSKAPVDAYKQLTGWEQQLRSLQAQRAAAIRGAVLPPIAPGAPVTYEQWAGQLLTKLGDPVCSENVTALVTWQSAESTTARFNPLATTHDEPGATSFNTIGVRNFVSLDQGLDATVATLRYGSLTYGYQFVLASLASCASADQTAAAINASSWCAGCAFGGYVTNLLPAVRADYPAYASRIVSAG